MAELISYAQNFEDVILWRALGHIKDGRYIDIGAQDPLVDSVSLMFYEHGWRGVHVEPTPHYAGLLRQARPEDAVFQAAVGAKSGVMSFYEFPNTGLSTADHHIAKKHIKAGYPWRKIVVPSVTIDDVFSHEPGNEVHWLKIDVEGGEKQVLQGWIHSPFRPWIVLIESTRPLTQVDSHKNWEALILRKGYKFAYFDGLNRFYCANEHAELQSAFSVGPNVFDHFALSGASTSTFCANLNAQIRSLREQREQERKEAEQRLAGRERELMDEIGVHRADAERKAQTSVGEKMELNARLQASQFEVIEAERRLAEREQALGTQLVASEANIAQLSRTLAGREREFAERLAATQRDALAAAREIARREQEFDAQLRTHMAEVSTLSQTLASREREFAERLAATQRDAVAAGREIARREQEFDAQLRTYVSEVSTLSQTLANREREFNERLENVQREMLIVAEQSVARERELGAQLLESQADAARNTQSHALREGVLHEQIRASRLHLQWLSQRIVLRERELAKELGASRATAIRLTETVRKLDERISALTRETNIAKQQHSEQLHAHQDREQQLEHDIQRQTAEISDLERARADLIAQLDELLRLEREADQGRRQGLDKLNFELGALHRARSWWPTIYLREIARRIAGARPSIAEPRGQAARGAVAPPAIAASNLAALLRHEDQQFVEAMYLTLLKRPSDPDGFKYYLGRLHAGISKLQILSEVLSSPEARAWNIELPGLQNGVRLYKIAQLPVIGYIVRIFADIERSSALDRHMRSVERQALLLAQHADASFAQFEQSLGFLRDQAVRQMDQVRAVVQNPATPNGANSTVTASHPLPAPPSREPEGLSELSARARIIYTKLKAAAGRPY